MKTNDFKFIDLFSGLGGFHVALNRLGGTCVFASEWKDNLRELYKSNFGIMPEGDITKVTPSSIPDHNLLTAGFPCQPFSKAGEQLGFECTAQGNLFFNVSEILDTKKPDYFILENVPNLLKHDNGRTWQRIQEILGTGKDGLGYYISATKLSPHNFGIPQIRERVYIVGSKIPLENFSWPEKTNQITSISSILDDAPEDAKQLSAQVKECLETWDRFLKACPPEVEPPWFPLWSMEWGADYPFEDETPYAIQALQGTDALDSYRGSHGIDLGSIISATDKWQALPSHARSKVMKFPKWKKDFIRLNRSFYAENKYWLERWIPLILKFPSSLQKLEWNVKGEERDIWKYVIQFRASGVRVKRRTTAPSLIAMTDTQVPIIAWQKRYMTPTECARLQSLEELHYLPSSPTQAFKALGNAVNSNVVELVAKALLSTAP
ncbi:DNA (cytosine-5-)-methyltransferase [Pseudomonas sp. PS02290]|uniref:DNA (cytosine-5-)-methyltransferase n=1 Tax=Pseudomonas sp. PS02290 TaxID=2991430 RepID=UPI002499FB23|nr:DNA (cytosine-5-)-methyltransferase [Pseudomonas sp. PS02290]